MAAGGWRLAAGGWRLAAGGWRLPNIIDSDTAGCNFSITSGTDCGYNPLTKVGDDYSEWAHLYFVTLGNLALCAPGNASNICIQVSGYGLINTAYFTNMQSGMYWSGTEYVSPGSGEAWRFNTRWGYQWFNPVSDSLYAVAVRSGDVLRVDGTVPEPHSLALALTALAGLGVARRLRRAA